MARRTPKPEPTRTGVLECIAQNCPYCGAAMWSDYENTRTITTLTEVVQLRLKVRRCPNQACSHYHQPYRPECEGGWALPKHEFGDELVALSVQANERIQARLEQQGRVILAMDGLQPDMGPEVLWVVRDCLSGEALYACALLSSAQADLSKVLETVKQRLPVPVDGIVSDGQQSLRKAIAKTFPDVPHGLCHFHYLREAARLIYDADRHAKKELKKQVREVRPLERQATRRHDEMGRIIHDYCQAVRSALTADGRPPLTASGLRLRQRLTAIVSSLARVRQKRGFQPN